ncbi:MAG: hypothetical protein H7Z74_16465 [Anaerolineae bacterium]|nr:hypothetical protein [Gemmatimonadaceae bacterium]
MTTDEDNDGIRDDCEYQLAYQFRPQVARNNHDESPEKEPYWSVTRIDGTVTGIKIFYAFSFYRDEGDHYLQTGSHHGDSEFVILEVKNNMDNSNYRMWQLDYATLSAHWNAGIADNTARYAFNDLEYPSGYRRRPRVWSSYNKHANYRSKAVCNGVLNDECTTTFSGTVYDDLEVLSSANIGNQYNRTPDVPYWIKNCVGSRNPDFGLHGTECFWAIEEFAGWTPYYTGQNRSTGYFAMLYAYRF